MWKREEEIRREHKSSPKWRLIRIIISNQRQLD